MLERWLALIARVSDTPREGLAREIFDQLHASYTSAGRHYHNLQHIDACLRHLDSVHHLAEHADLLEMAVWFHDAIYDSHRSDNEIASANLAESALVQFDVSSSVTDNVRKLILATQHDAAPADRDSALIIDIDLSILGQPAAIFDEYEANIRREYAWVSDVDYRAGRSKVLGRFLDRPQIYNTEYFHDMLESSARCNLARSLAMLAR